MIPIVRAITKEVSILNWRDYFPHLLQNVHLSHGHLWTTIEFYKERFKNYRQKILRSFTAIYTNGIMQFFLLMRLDIFFLDFNKLLYSMHNTFYYTY